jgi:hypothetical protein
MEPLLKIHFSDRCRLGRIVSGDEAHRRTFPCSLREADADSRACSRYLSVKSAKAGKHIAPQFSAPDRFLDAVDVRFADIHTLCNVRLHRQKGADAAARFVSLSEASAAESHAPQRDCALIVRIPSRVNRKRSARRVSLPGSARPFQAPERAGGGGADLLSRLCRWPSWFRFAAFGRRTWRAAPRNDGGPRWNTHQARARRSRQP